MGKALERVSSCEILRSHRRLAFREGPYAYAITREGDNSLYEVTDGRETFTVRIEWAFGQGGAGQTYVFEKNGNWYESRVSFFNDSQGLGLTLGAATAKPASLEEAAGRLMSPADARDGFDCHSTGTVHAHKLDVEDAIPGVECENCPGGGARSGDSCGEHERGQACGSLDPEYGGDVGLLRALPPDLGAD